MASVPFHDWRRNGGDTDTSQMPSESPPFEASHRPSGEKHSGVPSA